MRIGLIADIHGNLPALSQVLEELDGRRVDLVLCAGDLVCYGADPNGVIGVLRERHVACVAGNYDAAIAWDRAAASVKPSSPANEPLKRAALLWTKEHVTPGNKKFLRSLPWTMQYNLEGVRLFVLHAGLDSLDEWIAPDNAQGVADLAMRIGADVIVLGHTHAACEYTCRGVCFVNPGAVGRSLDRDPRAAYAVLDLDHRRAEFYRVDYDLGAAVREIEDSGMPREIAALVRCGARRIEEIMVI